jgi:hypothetical protein
MQELQNLDLSALVDMLSEHTVKYTRILANGGNKDEYNKCRKTIQFLQREIADRKNSDGNSTVNNMDFIFRQD